MAVKLRLNSIESATSNQQLHVKYTIVSPKIGDVPIAVLVPSQDLTAAEEQARKALLDWADELHNACKISPLQVGE